MISFRIFFIKLSTDELLVHTKTARFFPNERCVPWIKKRVIFERFIYFKIVSTIFNFGFIPVLFISFESLLRQLYVHYHIDRFVSLPVPSIIFQIFKGIVLPNLSTVLYVIYRRIKQLHISIHLDICLYE